MINSKIKAVVLDIDGTLFNTSHQISENTKKKLIKIQKQGIKIILASGRPTPGLLKISEELEIEKYNGFLVSYNGAVITDCQTQKDIYKKPIPQKLASKVLKHLKQYDVITIIFDKDYVCVEDVYNCNIDGVKKDPFNVLKHESKGNNLLLKEVRDLNKYLTYDPIKILVSSSPINLQNIHKNLSSPFENELNCTFSAPFFFEFTDLGVDKASALANTLPKYGIKSENIIAFGDGQNDKSMLEFAGIGVAMGNSSNELKQIANFVTLSNDEDGIVYALEHYGI